MKRETILLGLAIMCSPLTVHAQSQCKGVTETAKRLACYDSVATADSVALAIPEGVRYDGWLVSAKTNPITDAKEATALLFADESGRYVRKPSLVARCAAGQLDVMIDWSEYLAGGDQVTYRFDKRPPATTRWTPSTSKVATFYRGKAWAFADSLKMFETLVAQTYPYQSGPKTVTFQLAGAQEALKAVFAACPATARR